MDLSISIPDDVFSSWKVDHLFLSRDEELVAYTIFLAAFGVGLDNFDVDTRYFVEFLGFEFFLILMVTKVSVGFGKTTEGPKYIVCCHLR